MLIYLLTYSLDNGTDYSQATTALPNFGQFSVLRTIQVNNCKTCNVFLLPTLMRQLSLFF